MKRCSFCEWMPILPMPVWPLAWQCSLGQNTVVGSMTLLLAMRGNMTTRSMSGPRLLYNFTAPRLGVELSLHRGALQQVVSHLDGLRMLSPTVEKCHNFIEDVGGRDETRQRRHDPVPVPGGCLMMRVFGNCQR